MHCFLIILFGTSALWKRVNVCNSSLQDHGMVLGSIPVWCCNPAQTDCVLYHREFYETAGKKVKFKRDAACWFSQIYILWQLALETKDYVIQSVFQKIFSWEPFLPNFCSKRSQNVQLYTRTNLPRTAFFGLDTRTM